MVHESTAIFHLGCAVVFLVANTIFELVYLKALKFAQDQAFNKLWINIWHVGVASNIGFNGYLRVDHEICIL